METLQALDIQAIRADFPILEQQVNGKPLAYFDNAATTQKPKVVIDALTQYYNEYNANIHRGLHALADRATKAYEDTRDAVKAFINAGEREEVIFTRGTTEGINLVAYSWGLSNLKAGDEIILSGMEHHSNIVPWQMVAERVGAIIRVIPVLPNGELDLAVAATLFNPKTKVLACVYVSNALGTINPVSQLITWAHAVGAVTLIDGAQATSHLNIDVQALDTDFFVFSAHKLYGPTGVGVLYGKRALLDAMPPYQGGGEMISEVTFEKTTYNELPYKFEAGTPNIGDTVALKFAIEYINQYGKEALSAYEHELMVYASEQLSQIEGLRLIGTAKEKVSVVSFVIDGVHPQDLGIMLDQHGIAIRTGHHCTQPLMKALGLPGTCRASFAFYNTKEEIDQLVTGINKSLRLLR